MLSGGLFGKSTLGGFYWKEGEASFAETTCMPPTIIALELAQGLKTFETLKARETSLKVMKSFCFPNVRQPWDVCSMTTQSGTDSGFDTHLYSKYRGKMESEWWQRKQERHRHAKLIVIEWSRREREEFLRAWEVCSNFKAGCIKMCAGKRQRRETRGIDDISLPILSFSLRMS